MGPLPVIAGVKELLQVGFSPRLYTHLLGLLLTPSISGKGPTLYLLFQLLLYNTPQKKQTFPSEKALRRPNGYTGELAKSPKRESAYRNTRPWPSNSIHLMRAHKKYIYLYIYIYRGLATKFSPCCFVDWWRVFGWIQSCWFGLGKDLFNSYDPVDSQGAIISGIHLSIPRLPFLTFAGWLSTNLIWS